jgi:hypothetical protein
LFFIVTMSKRKLVIDSNGKRISDLNDTTYDKAVGQ